MTAQHPGEHDPTEPERHDGDWPDATDEPATEEPSGHTGAGGPEDPGAGAGGTTGSGVTEPIEPTGPSDPTGPAGPGEDRAGDSGFGTPPPPPPGETAPPATSSSPTPPSAIPSESRNWAMGAHLSALIAAFVGGLSLLGPLIVWLIKKDEDAFVAHHAKEALNFNISVLIYMAAAIVLSIVTLGIGLIVVVPVGILAFLGWLVVTILAAVKASNGEGYRYPVTIRLIN
jgi:uncharacterized protein